LSDVRFYFFVSLVVVGMLAHRYAEENYDVALTWQTQFCPALAYKTELYVAQNDRAQADAAFATACTHCGTNSLDMSDVRLAYGR
jgi:hypothetical protein